MQDSKVIDRVGERVTDEKESPDRETGLHSGDSADVYGWQQYRKWISSAPATKSRRGAPDASLYTWKGYRNWAEQIKRNWSDS
ncbi:MAG: hypothetical protein WD448_10740 [Woeseia sp.]